MVRKTVTKLLPGELVWVGDGTIVCGLDWHWNRTTIGPEVLLCMQPNTTVLNRPNSYSDSLFGSEFALCLANNGELCMVSRTRCEKLHR